MDAESFNRFVHILRAVYLGRSETARTFLHNVPSEELEDWYRLADTWRSLIGDVACLEWSNAHARSDSR